MKEPLSPSSRAPRALLLALVLILAGEGVVSALLPVNQGRTQVDDLLADLESPQPYRPIVLWTDSVTAGAVAGARGDPVVISLSSTQAISMAGVYFTYRRFVATAGPPKVFVLSMGPESFHNDLHQVFTPTYFESAFLRWEEIIEFADRTGRYGQSLTMAGNKLLHPPSMLRRAEVKRAIQRLRSPGGPTMAAIPLFRVAGMDPELAVDLERRANQRVFEISSIARTFLEALAMETAATGTRMVLVTPAIPRSVAEGWKRTGYLDQFQGMLDEFASRHAHVTRTPLLQFATVEDVDMYDTVHLKPEPERAYGLVFLSRVKELAK